MRPADEIERLVKEMSFEAGVEMDADLRAAAARAQDQSEETTLAMRQKAVWRSLMKRSIIKPAIAVVIVVAVLAVGVERLTRSKPNKALAFSAQIHANTALDLDPEAALPLRDAQPEDFDVTWSSEDNGSLQILQGPSMRIWAITLINPGWDDAVAWAFSHLADIRESDATCVVPTKETPYAAALTSEGNLAVIKIGGHDETQAWLSWRVEKAVAPGYSPVQTLKLKNINSQSTTAENAAVDLDTGRVVSIPAEVLSAQPAEMLGWLEQNGIDAIAKKTDEGYGLVSVGLIFWTWTPGSWVKTSAVDLRERMASSSFQPRRPLLYKEDQYQPVFPFKTREGGIGMLQMLAVDASKETVEFRYRMVQEEAVAEAEAEDDPETQRLAASVSTLMHFGLMAWKYAEEHEWRFPDTIQQLENYAKQCDQDFQWILDNIEYVGAGTTASDPESTLIAYDRTLLAVGKGTYAVFRDGHAEFIEPDRLSEYGLSTEP